jgi:nicotinate phosphoribosyltransferase
MESAYGKELNHSMTDTDYYTFTMMQAVLHLQPNAEAEFELIVRSDESLVHLIPKIRAGLEVMAEQQFTEDELRSLAQRTYMKPDFIRFLGLFKFNPRYVHVGEKDGQLDVRVRGPWLHTIMFEQPLLSMISELRNREKYPDVTLTDVTEQLYKKFEWLKENATEEELGYLRVADFSTRRRLSYKAQEEVVQVMRHDFPGVFVGTSNFHLAREMNIAAIGTMAHQWLMGYQQFGRLQESHSAALEAWVQEYRGELGIALTDTIGSDYFLSKFDPFFAKLFDGVRHDSGAPLPWAEKFIAHYEKLGIDPMTKTLVFSDSLSFPVCLEIIRALKGRIKFSFGIGTNLGCDVPGVKPLSIVMKMVKCNGAPVVKFSDDPIKVVCRDKSFQQYAESVFGINTQQSA